ncbi:MAG TPA: cyclic nucleotide-binding domain-containing protein [Actinomycetota bacterium]|nr:cyclic nucleotide-binding domain-containing protein [Actinomycetota bacterium]
MSCVHDEDLAKLRKVALFSVLSEEELDRFARAGKTVEHSSGETLVEEGAVGFRFYLILSGAAVVERGAEEVARIGPGDFVGEISLLGGGHATATVRCTEPTQCFTLQRERFWEVLEAEPRIALRILEVVARRLEQELHEKQRESLSD